MDDHSMTDKVSAEINRDKSQQSMDRATAERREVSGYERISLNGPGEVFLIQDAHESLVVEAEADLLPHVRAVVEGRTLLLGLSGEARTPRVRPAVLRYHLVAMTVAALHLAGVGTIHLPALQTASLEVDLTGSGDIQIDCLSAGRIVARLGGVGNVELSGHAREQHVQISGSATYRAGRLRGERAEIEITGSGDATLWVTETLSVRISNNGSVKVYGQPAIVQEITGIGQLIRLEQADGSSGD